MKVKFLLHKETREFVEITNYGGTPMVFTSELPHMPLNADTSNDDILKYIKSNYPSINFDDYEVVEFDLVIAGDIGADIRNKLSPPKNLVAMLEQYFELEDSTDKIVLLKYIKMEMNTTKTSIDYLSKLL